MKTIEIIYHEFVTELENKVYDKSHSLTKYKNTVMLDTLKKAKSRIEKRFSKLQEPLNMSEEEVKKLYKDLKAEAKNETANIRHKAITQFLNALNDAGLVNSPTPSKPEKVKRQLAIEPEADDLRLLQAYKQTAAWFETKYPDEPIYKSTRYTDELMSAFIFSLVSQAYISFPTLIKSLNRLKRDDVFEDAIYLQMSESKYSETKRIRVPLPLTSALLLQMILKFELSEYPFVRFSNETMGKWLKRISNNHIQSFRALINVAQIAHIEKLPPIMLSVYSKNVSTYSIESRRYTELDKIKYNKIKLDKTDRSVETERKDVTLIYSGEHIRVMKKIVSLIDNSSNIQTIKLDVAKYIEANRALINTNETCEILSRYVEYLLSGKKKLKINSIKTYYSAFYAILIDLTAERPLSSMDDDELQSFFIELVELDHTERKNKENNMPRKVRHFAEWYLSEIRDMSDEEIHDDFLNSRELKGTSSNIRTSIITPREFENLLDELRGCLTAEDYDVIEVTAILGFYCGMRKLEIEKLRLQNLNFELNSMIRIKKSKTTSGKRILHLRYLMPDYFLRIIQNYHEKRMHEEKGKGEKFLVPYDLQPYVKIFSMAMKSYFGDNTLTFHSLRHCCGSWLSAELMLTCYPDALKYMPIGLRSRHVSKLNMPKYENLLGATHDTVGMFTRIAKIMGHSSPEITLKYYVHIMDIFDEYFIRKADAEHQYLTLTQTMNLIEGVDYNTLQKAVFLDKAHGKRNKKEIIQYLNDTF